MAGDRYHWSEHLTGGALRCDSRGSPAATLRSSYGQKMAGPDFSEPAGAESVGGTRLPRE